MVKPAIPGTRYEPVVGWPAVPHGLFLHEATSVGVDSRDRVYVFNRGQWPMIVFDKEGNFLDAWGAGEFDRPHGVSFDAEDNMYLADDANFVQKRTSDGEVLMTLGDRGVDKPRHTGEPFNSPTHVAIDPINGDWFVSDGYRNSSVHRFDASGKHVKSWGESGSGPGQFALPHNICMVGDDRVLVADRENYRLQMFTVDGEFLLEKRVHKPQALFAGTGDDTNIYVAEGRPPAVMEGVARLGKRVAVLDRDLNELVSIGNEMSGQAPDQFISPHAMAVDSEGSIYVAEVSYNGLGSRLEPAREVISLRKWRRADADGAAGQGFSGRTLEQYVKGLRNDGPGGGAPINSPYG
ncbi:MAG: peptidyl-alpha-hydroxyglycine alpha-amidating lyase family protein [Dehalococcoidia bacterium]|nr:peptidyl-alpha-hydroxyglycine alpha-amidating lyase family protein [Dehalococcoidia bacterium]